MILQVKQKTKFWKIGPCTFNAKGALIQVKKLFGNYYISELSLSYPKLFSRPPVFAHDKKYRPIHRKLVLSQVLQEKFKSADFLFYFDL